MDRNETKLVDEMLSHLRADFIDHDDSSQVANFYANRAVFITGATGFIGKALVEKLVRSCKHIGRIYLLIREKRGKDAESRLAELTKSQMFGRLRTLPGGRQALEKKLRAVPGDITLPLFGLSQSQLDELSQEVSVVINSAATVRFSEPIEVAVRNNIFSVQQLMAVCDRLANLRALIHLSTAYSNCQKRDTIRECFYEPPMRGDQLLGSVAQLAELEAELARLGARERGANEERLEGSESLEQERYYGSGGPAVMAEGFRAESLLERFTELALISGQRPNTYTFTKAVSEFYLLELASKRGGRYLGVGAEAQLAVVRPSIVCGAWREPEVGFVDNYNGATGAILSLYTGALQAMPGRPELVADLVPVDMLVSMLLSLGRFLVEGAPAGQTSPERHQGAYLFNFVSGSRNPLRWGQVTEEIRKLAYRYPSSQLVRLPGCYFVRGGPSFELADLVLHKWPARLAQRVSRCTGGGGTGWLAGYAKMRQMTDTLTPFTSNQWRLSDSNVRHLLAQQTDSDQSLFAFDVMQLDWPVYLRNYIIGARLYTLKDEPRHLGRALRSMRK